MKAGVNPRTRADASAVWDLPGCALEAPVVNRAGRTQLNKDFHQELRNSSIRFLLVRVLVLVILIDGLASVDQPDQQADYDYEQDHDYGLGQGVERSDPFSRWQGCKVTG
jgi:hypothetical protein